MMLSSSNKHVTHKPFR